MMSHASLFPSDSSILHAKLQVFHQPAYTKESRNDKAGDEYQSVKRVPAFAGTLVSPPYSHQGMSQTCPDD
jgi:hypothetical protein